MFHILEDCLQKKMMSTQWNNNDGTRLTNAIQFEMLVWNAYGKAAEPRTKQYVLPAYVF